MWIHIRCLDFNIVELCYKPKHYKHGENWFIFLKCSELSHKIESVCYHNLSQKIWMLLWNKDISLHFKQQITPSIVLCGNNQTVECLHWSLFIVLQCVYVKKDNELFVFFQIYLVHVEVKYFGMHLLYVGMLNQKILNE